MMVGIQASRNFDDYAVFLRAMGTSLSMLSDDPGQLTIVSAGPARLNSMVLEFANVSERSLKARGISVKIRKVPPSWIKENVENLDYFAYFSKPKEAVSPLLKYVEDRDIEVGVYRF